MMTDPSPSQLQDLKSLNAKIEELNKQIRQEGPVIDRIQELRGRSVQLERQAKAGRLRKRSLARRGGKGKGLHKRGKPKEADELSGIYAEMDSLEDQLDKIEDLKDQRQSHIKRRRTIMKELEAKASVDAQSAQKITECKGQLEFLEEGIDKIRKARKLLKKASSSMKGAKQHLGKAKDAAFTDMMFGGGIIGTVSAFKKHKSMKRADTAMAPARRYIKQANKLLKSLDIRTRAVGAGVPQINLFADLFFDSWWRDGDIHDKIAKAELDAEMSVTRLKRQMSQLETMEEAFKQQHYRVENEIYELYLDAESAAANEIIQRASR
jgi:hypothetical protein